MKTCPACQSTYPDDFSLCPRDGAHLTAQATETEAQLAAGLSRRFRLVRRLGKGGMGTVFLAEQIGVGNRPVALKVLNRKLLDDPDFLLRFQNEAGSTGRIHHPNVVTIYESAQSDDGTPYIAMEFLEGESLREVLKQRGALPVAEVAEILQQAARGLNAAHKLGIIHRDLKPDNIFLTYPDDVAAPLVGAHDAVAFAHDVGAGLVPALPVGNADAFINSLIRNFSEATTGQAEPVELEELSSSVPTIALAVVGVVVQAIAVTVNKFLDAWKKIEEIRELRERLTKIGMKGAAVEELTGRVGEIVEEAIEGSITTVLSEYKAMGAGGTS
jgi:serine/threonine protein kinase